MLPNPWTELTAGACTVLVSTASSLVGRDQRLWRAMDVTRISFGHVDATLLRAEVATLLG